MAAPAVAAATAKSLIKKLLLNTQSGPPREIQRRHLSIPVRTRAAYGTLRSTGKSEKERIQRQKQKEKTELLVKRRTRSERELDEVGFLKRYGNDSAAHVPVLLGEVLDVFASVRLKSFVDCTLGAGGHSAAIIQAHPELQFYVGLDVDPVALQIGQVEIKSILQRDSDGRRGDLQVHTLLRNFNSIRTVLQDIDGKHKPSGIQGILMDLGMSSMQVNCAERGFSVLADGPLDMRMNPQASLKAEDILNLWPDAEVGRILRDYGEESNWLSLQKKIVRARLSGGLHSTRELVDLIKSSTSWTRGERRGWIKTATRVFQALRIAVNDELNTLKDSIWSCFDSLASGGRLAVISFHSLEDRIVKQAFLDIINCRDDVANEERHSSNSAEPDSCKINEAWIKQTVQGPDASILTKRPITPSESEERLNPRSRSAKLRVIEKT